MLFTPEMLSGAAREVTQRAREVTQRARQAATAAREATQRVALSPAVLSAELRQRITTLEEQAPCGALLRRFFVVHGSL